MMCSMTLQITQVREIGHWASWRLGGHFPSYKLDILSLQSRLLMVYLVPVTCRDDCGKLLCELLQFTTRFLLSGPAAVFGSRSFRKKVTPSWWICRFSMEKYRGPSEVGMKE